MARLEGPASSSRLAAVERDMSAAGWRLKWVPLVKSGAHGAEVHPGPRHGHRRRQGGPDRPQGSHRGVGLRALRGLLSALRLGRAGPGRALAGLRGHHSRGDRAGGDRPSRGGRRRRLGADVQPAAGRRAVLPGDPHAELAGRAQRRPGRPRARARDARLPLRAHRQRAHRQGRPAQDPLAQGGAPRLVGAHPLAVRLQGVHPLQAHRRGGHRLARGQRLLSLRPLQEDLGQGGLRPPRYPRREAAAHLPLDPGDR